MGPARFGVELGPERCPNRVGQHCRALLWSEVVETGELLGAATGESRAKQVVALSCVRAEFRATGDHDRAAHLGEPGIDRGLGEPAEGPGLVLGTALEMDAA